MSTSQPSLTPTLADVLNTVPEMKVARQARSNMASGIRTVCRVLDRRPSDVPIHAPTYRRLIGAASFGAVGVTRLRWKNARSETTRAIRLSGLSSDQVPEVAPLSYEWESVSLRAGSATERSVLRRFGRHCCFLGVGPRQVDDTTLEAFQRYLDRHQLSKTPQRTIKDVTRCWNRYVASEPTTGTKRLVGLKKSDNGYSLPWDSFPRSFCEDAEAFKRDSLAPKIFSQMHERKPVRESTATQRHRMIRRLASAAVHSGVPIDELSDLGALVHPRRLKRGLEYMVDRNGGTPNTQVFDMTLLAYVIAVHWSGLDEDEVHQIRIWLSKVRQKPRGMTEKNRERLRQFTSDKVIATVLRLPDTLVENAQARPVDTRSALIVQNAVAIGLLLVAPVRLANLCNLDRKKHFQHAFSVEKRRYHLVIPAEEVKNDIDLEHPIPRWLMNIIELYMEKYQPLLSGDSSSSLLFPGRKHAAKTTSGLYQNITGTIYREIGLKMNPHLFRHFSAYLFLRANPGHYESVRQLLGHKNIQTTIEFYASFETTEAMHRYNEILTNHRSS